MKKLLVVCLLFYFSVTSVFAESGWFGDTAINTRTDTTAFDNNLSSADTDVQKALETLDELAAGGGSGDAVTVNTTAIDTTANIKDGTDITWIITDGGAGGPDDIDGQVTNDSHSHTSTTLSGIDISADTNLTAGTGAVLTDDALSVDHDAATNFVANEHIDWTGVDFLVGTATALTANEIIVGTTPGGELGNTWASPTVNATHSGSAHHDAVTITDTTTINLTLTGQLLQADGLYTAGDDLTLTGADFDVDSTVTRDTEWDTLAEINTASTDADILIFQNLAVAGQTTVATDAVADTLTLVGAGITAITTNAATDTVTFTSTEVDGSTTNEINTVTLPDANVTAGLGITFTQSGSIAITESVADTVLFTVTEVDPTVDTAAEILAIIDNTALNFGTGVLTATGFVGPLTGNADTVTTNANLTGPITSAGNATSIAAQTGTGSTFVVDTSPTIVTPTITIKATIPEIENTGNITIDAINAAAASTVVIQNSDATYTANLTVDGNATIAGTVGGSNLSGTNTGDNTVATSGDSATAFFSSGEIADAQISDTLTSSTCTGNAATVTNATLTTALTVDTGTVGLTGNVANTSVLTLGAGASSVSGSNTGDQTAESTTVTSPLVLTTYDISIPAATNAAAGHASAAHITAIEANTTHAADNTQAHTDYLLNNANDTTSGVITSAGLIVADGQTVGAPTNKWLFDDTGGDISCTGNVGIGEVAPATALEITGAISMDSIDGNTLIVSANSAYTTITLAMAAAAAGDTILVAEGTYAEKVTYTQDNITLKAIGAAENTIISGAANDKSVEFSTKSGCVLDGFTVNQTSVNADTDRTIDSSNDSATDYTVVKNCIINSTVSDAFAQIGIRFTDGNGIAFNNRITIINTGTGTCSGIGIQAVGAGHTFYIENNKIVITVSTETTGTCYGIVAEANTTKYINNNSIIITSSAITTGETNGISTGGTAYVNGNVIRVTNSSTANANAITVVSGATVYLSANELYCVTSDADGKWLKNVGTVYATGNTITGDAAITVGTLYDGYNAIDGMSKSTTQPAFLAHPTTAQTNLAINSEVTIVFGTERFDQGSDFASNTFTAPITGRYQFNFSTLIGNIDTAASYYEVEMITSNKTYRVEYLTPAQPLAADGNWTMSASFFVDMDINDTSLMNFNQVGGTQQTDIETSTFFSGYLAC